MEERYHHDERYYKTMEDVWFEDGLGGLGWRAYGNVPMLWDVGGQRMFGCGSP